MAVVQINPTKITGPWAEGFVLDRHTVSSVPTGDQYYRFDTKRTELGELVYKLKYGAGSLESIVDTVEAFLKEWNPEFECFATAPPSLLRKAQPITEIARSLSERLSIALCENALAKVKPTEQMKNIDRTKRLVILAEAIQRGTGDVGGKSVLLLDDLYDSGATLRRCADVLQKECGVKSVRALALTRTKG
jgi:predicted amidophosphoribosyltransferase